MKFGKSYEDFAKEDSSTGGGTTFIRALKEGTTVVRFLTEPAQWIGYYEHYNPNPGGFSFPCTQEDDCPGCNSPIEKMRGRGRKVAFPVLVDDKWVNVYKVPKKFAERLAKRAERWGTITDRDYEITRTGTSTDTDYDVESGDKSRVDVDKYEVPDIQKLLEDTWNQVWGDEVVVDEPAKPKAQPLHAQAAELPTSGESAKDVEVTEEELRDMSPTALKKLLKSQGVDLPDEVVVSKDTDEIVDWFIESQKIPF